MNEDGKIIRWMVLAKLSPVLFVILIVFIGIVKECATEEPDIERQNACQEWVTDTYIVDAGYNGFRIRYFTAEKVTKKELGDITVADSIWQFEEQMQQDALIRFNDMLHLDIYEFARFAKNYGHKDIIIDCIFVTGPEKEKLYIGPHPKIKNSAKWIDPNTNQGLQWINHNDIYFYDGKGSKTYRYYRCPYPYDTSATDERFSHFSEDQRVR
jgi:hypothetical protein